jgi:hypothetical protein
MTIVFTWFALNADLNVVRYMPRNTESDSKLLSGVPLMDQRNPGNNLESRSISNF